jgi:23S rRNA maturation-related 3'-5' exoribonuclease YhaM
MNLKERYLQIYNTYIKREGSDKLLDYLLSKSSDFFTAPASTRFHGAYEGGLVEHSINVFNCLKDYLSRERVKDIYEMNYDDESLAIVALLHDLCKINCYKVSSRNVKDENGVWQSVPFYEYDDR